MTTQLGRKTIDDIQEFARERDLPIPGGYLASGEGGVHLGDAVRVIEVRATHDPQRVAFERRTYGRHKGAAKASPETKRRASFLFRVFASGRAFLSLI